MISIFIAVHSAGMACLSTHCTTISFL